MRYVIVIMLNIVNTITFMLKLNENPQIECKEHKKHKYMYMIAPT